MFTEGVRPVLGRVIGHFRGEQAVESGGVQASTEWLAAAPSDSCSAAPVLAFPTPDCAQPAVEQGPDAQLAFETELLKLSQALLDLSDATCLAALNLSIQASRLGEPGKALISASNDIEGLTAESKHASERLYQLLTSAEAVR